MARFSNNAWMQSPRWRIGLLASCALVLAAAPVSAQPSGAPKAEAPALPPLPAADMAIEPSDVLPLPHPGDAEKVDLKAIESMLQQESGQAPVQTDIPAAVAAPPAVVPVPATTTPTVPAAPPVKEATKEATPATSAAKEPAVPPLPDQVPAIPPVTPAAPAPLPALENDIPPVSLPETTKKDAGVPDLFDIPTAPAAPETGKEAAPAVKKEDVKKADKKTIPKKQAEDAAKGAEDGASAVPPPPPIGDEKKEDDKPKKKAKKKTDDTSMQSKRGGSLHNNYKTQILPEAIYQRKYDAPNRHLPKAVYYTDYEHQFFGAIVRNDLQAVHAFLATGVDLSVRNDQGDTPLLHAVRHQRLNIAQLLITRGARANELDASGLSAAHMAVLMGNSDLVSMLGKKGANFDIMDVDGRTPLMYAVNNNNFPLVTALLESGASPNMSMASGQTALHIASARGNQAMVQLLLRHGAITGARDNSGLTPQDHAYYYGQPHLVEILTPSASNFNAMGTPLPVNKPERDTAPPNAPSVQDLRMKGGSSAFFAPQQPYQPQGYPPAAQPGFPQPIGSGVFR